MIAISNPHDRHDRKQLTVSQSNEDRSAHWVISLLTADLPPRFENSAGRKVELSIVDYDDVHHDIQSDSILLPVDLTAIVVGQDTTKYYYRQRVNNVGAISPVLDLDCYVTRDNNDQEDLGDPYLLIQFQVSQQPNEDIAMNEPTRQQFQGSSQDQGLDVSRPAQSRPHVDRNENAMGGIDLPAGTIKNDEVEKERLDADFNYQDGKAIPEPVRE